MHNEKAIAVSEKHQKTSEVFGRLSEAVCGVMNHNETILQRGVFENLMRNLIINAYMRAWRKRCHC